MDQWNAPEGFSVNVASANASQVGFLGPLFSLGKFHLVKMHLEVTGRSHKPDMNVKLIERSFVHLCTCYPTLRINSPLSMDLNSESNG